MASKKSTQSSANIHGIVKIIAIGIAGYLIIGFIQQYMGANAFTGLQSSATTDQTTGTTGSGGAVCDTCTQTGQLGKKCSGSCPDGQTCSLNVDTGTCGCYDNNNDGGSTL